MRHFSMSVAANGRDSSPFCSAKLRLVKGILSGIGMEKSSRSVNFKLIKQT